MTLTPVVTVTDGEITDVADAPLMADRANRAGVAFASLAVIVAACLCLFVTPYDATHTTHTATANIPADRDAFLSEDSPRWSCLTDGNRLCGPFHGPTR